MKVKCNWPYYYVCGSDGSGGNQEPKVSENGFTWRKILPLEAERLQTFPDNFTDGVSNSQRFKALGNSFTVDMIKHILGFMNE